MNSRSPHRAQQPLLPGLHEEDQYEGVAEEKTIASAAADLPADAVPDTDVQPAPALPNQTPPLVIAVDTHAILYQVFHAMPPLTSPSGLPVGAIHGMLRDLLEIRERYRPDYLFFTFDLSEDTFRNEIYPDYKGHREEMPVDLR
jgi:DNA polymerase-1